MKLEEKIMKLRKEKGLSQEEFGETIGVSRQAVSKWENGEAKPDISKVKTICEKYSLSYEYLLDDEIEETVVKQDEEKEEKQAKEANLNEEKDSKVGPSKKERKAWKKILKVLIIIFLIYLLIVFYKVIMYIKIIVVANSFNEENYEICQTLKTINVENQISEVNTRMFKYNDMIVLKGHLNTYNTSEGKIINDYPNVVIYINNTTNDSYEMQWQEDHYNCKRLDKINIYDPSQIVKEYVPDNPLYILLMAIDPTRVVLPNGTMFNFSSTNMDVVTLNGVGLIESYVGKDIYGGISINRYSYNYTEWMYEDNYKNPMEEYKDLIVYE